MNERLKELARIRGPHSLAHWLCQFIAERRARPNRRLLGR